MRAWIAWLALLVSAGADAQHLYTFPLDIPADVPRAQPIEPGGEGVFRFTARNPSTLAGLPTVQGVFFGDAATLAQYTFISADPMACPPPVLATMLGAPNLQFQLASLAPGAAVTCQYRVLRTIASRDDLKFQACGGIAAFPHCDYTGYGTASFRFGTLPPAQLVAAPAGTPSDGATALVRLTVRNLSDRAIVSRHVSTGCWEFGGGLFAPAPFEIENDFPGACPDGQGQGCINFTGQAFSSRAFAVGPIAAGGEASCLVRLRADAAPTQRLTIPISLYDDRVAFVDGGIGFDPRTPATTATLSLGPLPTIPAAGGWALVVLAMILVAIARRRNRRGCDTGH